MFLLREKGAGYPKRNNGAAAYRAPVLSGRRTFADLSDRFCSFFTDYQCEEVSEAYAGEERDFTADIKEVDFNTIPLLLDRDSAAILGSRKMGSMVDMVSQFEVADDYTQINVSGKPVRVTPLMYASPIKWLTNQKNGIPA